MRWRRAIVGGFIAEVLLTIAVMPGFAMGSEPVVIWTAVGGAGVATFLAALWVARRRGTTGNLLALACPEDCGRRRRWTLRRWAHQEHKNCSEGQRMKHALFAGTVLVLVASAATPAHAQFRGRLTSRAAAPSVDPRPASPTLQSVPIWWRSGIVALPEAITLAQPALGTGAPTGGVQLDIQPWSAQVYVDGTLAGRVEQFRGYYQPLELPAGPHTIVVVAPGREPFIFGVMVVPGRTYTQRTTLSWAGASLP
jgi:hypothetical protein